MNLNLLTDKKRNNTPWMWIPTLYFGQGIPYVVVATTFSLIMYKQLGISNADAAMYTAWLYMPWVIKPFWSPIVDLFKSKHWWIISMQFLIGILFAGVAFCIPAPHFLQSTLALLWLAAFSSATHDIAADGFYMLALNESEQSFFVGIRSMFYRISMVAGQGALVMLAGHWEQSLGSVRKAWSWTFAVIASFFLILAIYHLFVLPKPQHDQTRSNKALFSDFLTVFSSFFRKKDIYIVLLFVLLYRLGESQLVKIASPFMLDSRDIGGLGLSTTEVGFAYGTIGVIALTLGGILGGVAAAKNGLKRWLWPMALSMNIPNLVYVFFAFFQPENYWTICAGVAIEQFGYGFGFTAFMLYLIFVSQGTYQTAHYAICTGLMAMGMMLPGMSAGFLQEIIGYRFFFIWVCLCTVPGFLLLRYLNINPSFGKKAN